jgi:hypothetical protein
VSYEPSTTSTTGSGDVNMDAPQISTLREEETPPPQQPARTSKFRVKLLVNENTAGASVKDVLEDDGEDELEDEEDQLIDDEVPASDVSPSKGKLTPKKKKSARKKATGALCV